MLTHTGHQLCKDIEDLINEVILEDTRFERENRSAHREKVVLPVNLKFMNGLPAIPAFSRNFSPMGVGLITRKPIEINMLAMIQIYRLNNSSHSEVVGECRWCKPFGHDYWMSGWMFLRVPRQ